MSSLLKSTLFLLVISMLFTPAYAFDCSKAFSKTEKTICNNESLVALDNRMANFYRNAMRQISNKNKTTLRKSQHLWLASRNKCGSNVKCLKTRYNDWIREYFKFAKKLATLKNNASPNTSRNASVTRQKRKSKKVRTAKRSKTVSPAITVDRVAAPTVLSDD